MLFGPPPPAERPAKASAPAPKVEAAPRAMTVTGLTRRLQDLIDADPALGRLRVEGEITNWSRPASGHAYFTLKDAQSQVQAVMYRSALGKNAHQNFANGDRVEVKGALSLYAPRGAYQIVVDRMAPAGIGELYQKFVELKLALQAEGLFDADRKRPLPFLPKRVALITSASGAVVRDIIRTLERRGVPIDLIILPSAVQGAEAVPGLLSALAQALAYVSPEVVVFARGGGSLEDLWAFNDERLARAVAASPVPVVSAIGHETDFTILDFVADLRASTPTAAAELLWPPHAELQAEIENLGYTLAQAARHRLHTERQRLADFERQYLRLQTQAFRSERQALASLAARLHALDAQQVLARGFVAVDTPEGLPVRQAEGLAHGQALRLQWADGARDATITGG
jgi:exodeoxyribonuclease VII large subunit